MCACLCLYIGPNTQIQSILFHEFESAFVLHQHSPGLVYVPRWVVIHKTSFTNVVALMGHLLRVQWTVCLAVVLVVATLSELLIAVRPQTVQLRMEVPVHTGSELLEKMCAVNTVLPGSL